MNTEAKESSPVRVSDYRIPTGSPWAGAWKIAAGLGVLGLAVSLYGYKVDPTRFAFSYLFAFVVAVTLAVGSLFFVLVLYMTKASWGITVRRVAEFCMQPVWILAILAVPLTQMLPQLFPWTGTNHAALMSKENKDTPSEHGIAATGDASPLAQARGIAQREPAAMRDVPIANAKRMEAAEEGAEQEIVNHKRFFLNPKFFLARLTFYLFVWWQLTQRYFRLSTEQDKTKAASNTAAAQKLAPIALMLFGLTLSFFAFDWLLSLNATWYSTIFGVYVFAQTALFQMAFLILLTLMLRRSGLLGQAVTVEHYHDMGKLLFGWIVFWSYIAFAQFFLTWYSNIPDELSWFHQRWGDNGGTWKGVSLTIIAFHFFVPFWFLMSRNIKRRLPLLAVGATCMVVMHVVEVYWVVMPNFGPLAPSLFDLGSLVGVLGVYLAAVLYGMRDYALVAVGDPRLVRALEFENA